MHRSNNKLLKNCNKTPITTKSIKRTHPIPAEMTARQACFSLNSNKNFILIISFKYFITHISIPIIPGKSLTGLLLYCNNAKDRSLKIEIKACTNDFSLDTV